MPVVFVIAVLAVLVGVFFAATGRGGELAYEQTDHAPLDLGPVSAPDIALLRPPTALWGYNMQVTDEALDHIARAVRDRDITIAYLQEELANREPGDLNAPYGSVPPTRPDAFYPPTGRDDPQAGLAASPRDDYSQAGADLYPQTDRDDSPQAADPYSLADPDASRYPRDHAPADAGLGSAASSDVRAADTTSPGFGRSYTFPSYTEPADDVPSDPGPAATVRPDDGPADPAFAGPLDAGPIDADPVETDPVETGPVETGPLDAGPAPAAPDAPPPRSLTPPGILVASRPREAPQPQEVPEALQPQEAPEAHGYAQSAEATQPYDVDEPHDVTEPREATQPYDVQEPHDVEEPREATQPYDVAQPHEATQPSETMPATDDTLGPQGPFDTHDWWAEQEEAAREDARRQAEAQGAGLAPSGEPHAPEPPADASYGSAAEDNEPPDEAADQASAPAGPTGTVPNPVVPPPSETGTSPGDAGQSSTGPAKPPTPHDDGLSIAEEQSW